MLRKMSRPCCPLPSLRGRWSCSCHSRPRRSAEPRPDLERRGKVYSLAHANNVVYAGGTFKKVTRPGGQKGDVLNLAAFNENTGVWIPTFAPTVENTAGSRSR